MQLLLQIGHNGVWREWFQNGGRLWDDCAPNTLSKRLYAKLICIISWLIEYCVCQSYCGLIYLMVAQTGVLSKVLFNFFLVGLYNRSPALLGADGTFRLILIKSHRVPSNAVYVPGSHRQYLVKTVLLNWKVVGSSQIFLSPKKRYAYISL